ncbi:MAG: hypothetical protein DMG76_29570 [Acidobacteria bacterium]|nr:MAG: hypothetical protein DMG76_29570 [Acidobacteriota bacterium]
MEGVPLGGQPPLISWTDDGSEELADGEGPVGVHLVDPGGTRFVGVKKQQPSRLPGVRTVDSDDRSAAAAGHRTQCDLGILRRRRRDAPHALGVVDRVQAKGGTARLFEPRVAR